MRTAGRPADQGAGQDAAGAAASPQAVPVAARRPVLQGRPARGARRPGRGRHRDRGQPPAGGARPGDALGGRGRFDPGQLRSGDPAHAPRKRERVLTKKEIAAIWKACDELGRHEVARNYGRMVRFLLADGAAPRRGRVAPLWPYPRRRVAADREQGEQAAQPAAAAVGAGSGRAWRGARICVRWPQRGRLARSRC